MTQLAKQGWESCDDPREAGEVNHLCSTQAETGTWHTFQEGHEL